MRIRLIGWMAGILLVTLACGIAAPIPAPTQPGVETVVAQTMQALTAAAPVATQKPPVEATASSQPSGIPVSFQNVSFVIPNGLANGANPETVAAVGENDGGPWSVAPAHLKFTLTGYPLQGKFFEPYMLVYPAQDFEAVSDGAGQSLGMLRAILASPSAPLSKDKLPSVPGFNAAMVFASNTSVLPFQNGSGVRMLTEYAQYFASVNNQDLFYQFQGLTSDGKYYIIAILPVNAPFLAADEDPAAPVPSDGIAFPDYNTAGEAEFTAYYQAMTDKLNATSPEAFTPTLSQLDALIASISITSE